jgi:AP-1 complex subunit sigma 1/2
VHLYVEALDRYFGQVCELDLVFEFHRAHYVLDELVLGGYVAEPSKRAAVRAVAAQDAAVEEAKAGSLVEAALGTGDV